MTDHDGDGGLDLVADDRDDQAQDHRLTEILRTRRKVLDHRTRLRHERHRGEISQYQAETEYRDILESYLIDLEPIFADSDKSDVWDTELIDTWQMTVETDNSRRIRGKAGTTNKTRTAELNGLSDILELPNPITAGGEDFQIPFGVLDQAFRAANRALNDWGLELQLQPDESDEWEI